MTYTNKIVDGVEVQLTVEEITELEAKDAAWLSEQTAVAHANLMIAAQNALIKSDIIVIRCYSESVPVPAAWQAYRLALRAIVNGTDTTSLSLPAQPVYPSGA